MLTDGRGGAFVCADGGVVYCPAVEATVAGTAGAGDAMASTFAAFVALGRPVDVALKAATLNAASVVAHIDTQSGLLRREALEGGLPPAPNSVYANGNSEGYVMHNTLEATT